MEQPANDKNVFAHIQHLVTEEHKLFEKGNHDDAESTRLAAIQVELDQCWDLLRQRRAKRETGHPAGEAQARPADVVEKYIG